KFFFVQAEDGIRDFHVTGVQTCALPILDVVAEPLRARGVPAHQARERAASLLSRLNLPSRLFNLPPATFSGGEQQRVNIARGFKIGRASCRGRGELEVDGGGLREYVAQR